MTTKDEPFTEWLVCPKCNHQSPYSPIKAKTLAEDAERITKQARAALAQPEQDEVGTGCECPNCANGMGACHTEDAQPEQEPQKGGCTWCGGDCPQFECDTHNTWMNEPVIRRDLPPQPKEQETDRGVAYSMIDRFLANNLNSDEDYAAYSKALEIIYTTPPQRKPLTDEQRERIYNEWCSKRDEVSYDDLMLAVEAAHGIKEGA